MHAATAGSVHIVRLGAFWPGCFLKVLEKVKKVKKSKKKSLKVLKKVWKLKKPAGKKAPKHTLWKMSL